MQGIRNCYILVTMVENLLRFKKVVEAGSISKASRLLFISQPALSKSVRSLEKEYGVEILERHYLGVKPTVYGEILYRTACELEKAVLNIDKEILEERLSKEPVRQLHEIVIGCSTIWNDFLMPKVMRELNLLDTYTISVTNSTSEQLLKELVEEQHYDFVLCRILEGEKYRNLESIPLLKNQVAVFINMHHPLFSTGFDQNRLNELKWIKLKSLPVLRRSDLTPEGLSFFPESFFPPVVSYEVEDLMAAIQLIRNNYIILLPLALENLLKSYEIKPIPFTKNLTQTYWLGMVYHREREIPLFVQDVMNKIRLFYSNQAQNQPETGF